MIGGALAVPAAARQYPETIPLPNGWAPEGIATGFGNEFFSGSRMTGGIFRGNLKTGMGDVLVPGRTGGAATGNKIAVIHLKRGLRRGEIKRYLTDDDFDVPTTIAERGGFLWAVNARFTTPVTPATTYDVVRVSR